MVRYLSYVPEVIKGSLLYRRGLEVLSFLFCRRYKSLGRTAESSESHQLGSFRYRSSGYAGKFQKRAKGTDAACDRR